MRLVSYLRMGVSAVVLGCTAAFAGTGAAPPVHNIVLVHGAANDGSAWCDVYDLLRRDGFQVTVVQQPLTGLADDVAATKCAIDLQDGSSPERTSTLPTFCFPHMNERQSMSATTAD